MNPTLLVVGKREREKVWGSNVVKEKLNLIFKLKYIFLLKANLVEMIL